MMFNENYTLSIPVGDYDHIQGAADAPLTLVEYGDYQCPYCGQAYPIVKQLQQHFGDKMRFVFRDFPLSDIHQFAMGAAEAAQIAGDYNKFWDMHDKIYENQDAIDKAHLVQYASDMGIDSHEFKSKLDSGEKQSKIKKEFVSGAESGVNGTPSFFINGVKYNGSWDFESLKDVLTTVLQTV